MKRIQTLAVLAVGFLLTTCLNLSLSATPADTLTFDCLMLDLAGEMKQTQAFFENKQRELTVRLAAAEQEIVNTAGKNNRRYRRALETKLRLTEELALNQSLLEASTLKIRYRKGIDLIKLMYEKILGLDHHFTGLHTYQNISALSNPHTFPEFQKTKELLEKNKNRRYAMRLPAVLETNPFISATFTLVSVLLGENSQKEEDFEKIACILDFTVRMNGDLNVIRHETEFLKNANQKLREECERLFQDYTKPVGYLVSLETCRTQDDWETLFLKLEEVMANVEVGMTVEEGQILAASRDLVNIEFATQRVADFISKYSTFIGQGAQYYQKFDNIISTYQNETVCSEQLPRPFTELKADIKCTIEKFNHTYKLPELQGSRLKDLMYGVAE